MKCLIDPNHRLTPHFVEWALDNEQPDEGWTEEFFPTKNEAVERAEDLDKAKKCVILGELGTYKTRRGTKTDTYIYYWWNDYFDFSPGKRGETGVPSNAQTLHVDYVPLSDK